MYYIYYGDEVLHDPFGINQVCYDVSCSGGLNDKGSMSFTISSKHPLYNKLKMKSGEVIFKDDENVIFSGYISSLTLNFNKEFVVTAVGDLAYLGDILVRPYSTYEIRDNEDNVLDIPRAPNSTRGLFSWYIEKYNEKATIPFRIGLNEIPMLNDNPVYIYNQNRSSVASEIENNLIETYGGYLSARYENGARYLDYAADVRDINSQIIDFGVNLMDFYQEKSVDDIYTAVVPIGADEEGKELTLNDYPDGPYDAGAYYVQGDALINREAVTLYGYKEVQLDCRDIYTLEGIAKYAYSNLKHNSEPISNITVKAVDLALFMDKYKHLRVGEIVRIRSNPHDVDEYMVVSEMDIDMDSPENTEYTLGVVYDTLTGEQSSKLRSLNSSLDRTVDQVDSISEESKKAAKDASDALEKADQASSDASDALEKADKAVVSTEEEFYQSDSPLELEGGTWESTNVWVDGKYTWRRTLVTYGDGSTEYTPSETGVCITGNTGDEGEPGADGKDGKDGKTSYFHIMYSDVPNPTMPEQMTKTPSTYIGTYVDFIEEDSNNPLNYTWSRFEGEPGENGIPGTNGENGKTSYLHIAYANSADGRTGFSVSDSKDKLYIGQYTDFVQADSTDPTKYSWTLIKGEDGEDGAPGKDGTSVTITSTSITYQASTSGTTVPTGSWSTTVPTVAQGSYLWTKTVVNYSDGKSTTSYSVGRMGSNGTNGENGKDGTSVTVKSSAISYLASTNGTSVPSGNWSTSIPTVAQGSYLWTRTIVTYSDNSTVTSYSVSRMGVDGDDGANGKDGTSVTVTSTSVTYQASTNGTTAPTGTWSTTIPTVAAGSYLWTKTVVTYSDGKSTTSYSVSRNGTDGKNGENGKDGTNGENGKDGKMLYGTSSTAATNAAKSSTDVDSSFVLEKGVTVAIKFSNANTAANVTLNINNKGAKNVFLNGTRYAYWEANQTVIFTYDGTQWQVASTDVYANTTTIGNPSAKNIYIDGEAITLRDSDEDIAVFDKDGLMFPYVGDIPSVNHKTHIDTGYAALELRSKAWITLRAGHNRGEQLDPLEAYIYMPSPDDTISPIQINSINGLTLNKKTLFAQPPMVILSPSANQSLTGTSNTDNQVKLPNIVYNSSTNEELNILKVNTDGSVNIARDGVLDVSFNTEIDNHSMGSTLIITRIYLRKKSNDQLVQQVATATYTNGYSFTNTALNRIIPVEKGDILYAFVQNYQKPNDGYILGSADGTWLSVVYLSDL